jgi:hypothetical protein
MRLSNVSGTKILLIAAAWPALLLAVSAAALFVAVRSTIRESSGGLAAIGFGASPFFLGVLLGPSLGLVVAWSVARWLVRRPPAT